MLNIIIGGLAAAIITKTLHKHIYGKTPFSLLNCRYCLSHWVSGGVAAIYLPTTHVLLWLVEWFAITAICNLTLKFMEDECSKALKEATELLIKCKEIL